MYPISPIGPRDRDIEPVTLPQRVSPDGEREQPDPHEQPHRREPRAREEIVQPLPPSDEDDGDGHLIDVRV